MKVAIVWFTCNALELSKSIQQYFISGGDSIIVQGFGKLSPNPELKPGDWVKEMFSEVEAFVFIGASGIAVRLIAPCVDSKLTDPAVLSVDEKGRFVVPLLSGHIGGANEIALGLADYIGAQPVISTATDLNSLFSVDVFAIKNNFEINDLKKAKEFSAELLVSKKANCCIADPINSYYRITGTLPRELSITHSPRDDKNVPEFIISSYEDDKEKLVLFPKCLIVGIGCRKGVGLEKLYNFCVKVFEDYKLDLRSVKKICSIDIKKSEEGIIQLAQKVGVPFEVFSADNLSALGDGFTASSFVRQQVGVDNVCERAAVAGGAEKIIVKKTISDAMTLAVGIEKLTIDFQEVRYD